MGSISRHWGLFVFATTGVWGAAQVAAACTCPQRPQVVGDGGTMPENARAVFFWTPDLYIAYQTEIRVVSAGGSRTCASRVEPLGPEDLHTLHLLCEPDDGDELEITFSRDGQIMSRSKLGVVAHAPLPKRWANLGELPARRFETDIDTGTRCSSKSQVFGLQIPVRWSAESHPWSDISVVGALIDKTPYRRPLSGTCDRGFDTTLTDKLEIFSRGQGHHKLIRKTVALQVFVPGVGSHKTSSVTLNVPAEFEHRPVPSYAASQNGKLAADLSAIDTRRSLAQVYKRIELCSAKRSLTVELVVAGASGKVVDVSVDGLKDPARKACIRSAAQSVTFARFKRARDTISLQVLSK